MTASQNPPAPMTALRRFTSCFFARVHAEAEVERAETERAESERNRRDRLQAVEYAVAALTDFPATLALTMDGSAFSGYPSVVDGTGRRLAQSAVALLGEGVWLHHTRSLSGGPLASDRDEMALVVPDPAQGYRLLPVQDDATLADGLVRLGLHSGHHCNQVHIPHQR
ncbi:hypothetical protein OG735_00900 [Streptomyces sp. NBC_01210]|uniref:hypothetical protein n=1 Tax=Streptomyces sp. NBC_01210 TaxID=2903774 RepID=UPI002E0ECA75|nr:hypothetical protein OG735_00900 [Streptomyces sp. NBC_01210]